MNITVKYQNRNIDLSFAICKGYHPVRLISNGGEGGGISTDVNALTFATSPIISAKTVRNVELTNYTEECYRATWHRKTSEYVRAKVEGIIVMDTATIPFTGEGDNEPNAGNLLVHCRIASVQLNPATISWLGAVDVPYICLA